MPSTVYLDTGCPDVKFSGQVLPLASTPRVRWENLRNACSILAPLGKFETFAKPKYSTPCNYTVGPIEEKVLPPPMEFPAQSIVGSHPARSFCSHLGGVFCFVWFVVSYFFAIVPEVSISLVMH